MLQHGLYESGLLGNALHASRIDFIPSYLELGETGVVAFFLVSGFVIPLSLEKTGNIRVFWIHRILRIYPLYITVYIATILVQFGGGLQGLHDYAVNALSHLLMIQEYVRQKGFVGGSWTLSIEMVWYLGLSVALLLSFNKNTNILVFFAVFASVIASALCIYGVHVPMGRLSMLVCCVFGFVCFRWNKGDIAVRDFIVVSAVLMTAIAGNLLVGFHLYPDIHPSATFTTVRDSWLLAGLLFFGPFFSSKLKIWQNPALAYVGRISYSIYLVHGVILYLLKQTELSGVPFLFVTFIVTFIVASITYRYIEAPPIRLGHRKREV